MPTHFHFEMDLFRSAINCYCQRVILLFASMLLLASTSSLSAQERTVKMKIWKNEPVKILKLKVKGIPIGSGQKFFSDDDWLNGLTLRVKNTSGQTITFIDIELTFPETAASAQDPVVSYSLSYGSLPMDGPASPNTTPQLMPGEIADIQLSDEHLNGIKNLLRSTAHSEKINQVHMRVYQVLFSDDTLWSVGLLFRRDQSDPKSWIPIKQPSGKVYDNELRGIPHPNLLGLFATSNSHAGRRPDGVCVV